GTQTIAKLTFGGAYFSVNSLIDGRYSLNVKGNLTLDTSGAGMASDFALNFHRLFGDSDGNATVDQTDFIAFRNAFNNGPSIVFDYDGDGQVNQTDFIQFRNRFNLTV